MEDKQEIQKGKEEKELRETESNKQRYERKK
jgi:hypothetical protein